MTKSVVPTPGVAQPQGHYSHLMQVVGGKLLFIAGQTATDAQGRLIGKGDIEAQTRQVFENLKQILASAGATFRDVVKLNTYVLDIQEFRQKAGQLRKEYLGDHKSPSTLVQVAGLAHVDYLIEVEAIAALD